MVQVPREHLALLRCIIIAKVAFNLICIAGISKHLLPKAGAPNTFTNFSLGGGQNFR